MSRRKMLALLVGLVAVQAGLVAVYLVVEQRRLHPPPLSTVPPQAVSGELGPLLVRNREGETRDLAATKKPILVHFWATWCPPCREELPALLKAGALGEFDVVAVALDDDWQAIDAFPGARDSSLIVRAESDAARRLGVRQLPVTLLVDAEGRLRLRADGARDWTDGEFLRAWRLE